MNLRELADYLALSPTTVSRALNDFPEVAEATRQRVKRAAAELGYRPSHNARQLATGRSRLLGHVITRSRLALLGPLFPDLMAGASASAGERGYDLLLRVLDDAEEARFYRDLAATGRVDGVVVHGPLVHDRRMALLSDLKLPFIVHGRSEIDDAFSWLDVDNALASRLAVEHLLERGHRRVGLINGPADLHFAHRRRQGFIDALQRAGIDALPTWLFSGEMTEAYGFAVTDALLREGHAPTALFVTAMLPAFGALRAVRSHGLEMGRDIALVAYDDRVSWLDNPGIPPLLTTVGSSIREAGELLVHRLLDAIEDPTQAGATELLPLHFVQGESSGAGCATG